MKGIFRLWYHTKKISFTQEKLDGVGPVDNRPLTVNQLAPPFCLQIHLHTSQVTEVTAGQPLQLGCIDNEDLEEMGNLLND